MSAWFDRVRAVRDMTGLSSNEKVVLLLLATKADDDGASFPSHKWLADHSGLHRATVIRTVQALVEKKLLQSERRRDEAGDATSNRYTVVSAGDQVVSGDHHRGDPRRPPLSQEITTVVIQGDGGGDPVRHKEHSQERSKRSLKKEPEKRAASRSVVVRERGTSSAPHDPRVEKFLAWYLQAHERVRGCRLAKKQSEAAAAKLVEELGDDLHATSEAALADNPLYFDGSLSTLEKKADKYRAVATARRKGKTNGAAHAAQPLGGLTMAMLTRGAPS